MKKLSFLALILAVILLCGCSRLQMPAQQPRIVTGVTVIYENDQIRFFRRYTSDEKIQKVLSYLRLIDPKGAAQTDPETLPGGMYTITLLYADGTQQVYHQKNDNYLQENDGRWKIIDPKKAEWLGQLIEQTESDFD